jgi:hypothetical protein
MQDHFPDRTSSPRGHCVTFGTLIVASAGALSLVLMSGCHGAPDNSSGFVSSSADKAAEARLRHPADTMKPVQPFDEGFVVIAEPDASP